ncbi:MAG: hypothetical protein H7X99_04675 [Saprospiraceae bacterium]|nr:hypothetical protein [Saprospiraceae bacterium]
MNQQQEIEIRIWDYIDGLGNAEERSVIKNMIANEDIWRLKYSELLDVHKAIYSVELEQPSLRFTRNVMDEIARTHIAPATKKYINQRVVYGIAVFFITMIIGFLTYGISQIDWSSGASTESSIGIDLGKIDFSKMFNNTFVNVFMMMNIILGLMLLDRYLNNKKKQFFSENT